MGAELKRALITGITGQDGSYLAELLLEKGYEVHGVIRRSSSFNTGRIDHLYTNPQLHLHYGDLTDGSALARLLHKVAPNEIYNLGAMSHVRVSFDVPEYTGDVVGQGTVRLLEAIRESGLKVRLYQASSSELFGSSPPPQSETTPFRPRSPYAVAKLAAFWNVVNYREGYGLHASNGILFNHGSPRRGETFVERKICKAAARIKCGLQDKLFLGNIDARRDWGHAKDYVEAMWLMLQQDTPGDYVIATGKVRSVRQLLHEAFASLGLDWKEYVEIDERLFRPTEVEALCGDPSKAKSVLGWQPRITFFDLVQDMIRTDLKIAREGV